MKNYEDNLTFANKYDLYFSDMQIKTKDSEGNPFTGTTKEGKQYEMARIWLRGPGQRGFQFSSETLNSSPCWIQVPLAAIKRKIKGTTSVYTVTTPDPEAKRIVVYASDINDKKGFLTKTKERISVEDLSRCLEFGSKDKEVVGEKKDAPTSDIDSLFPKKDSSLKGKHSENAPVEQSKQESADSTSEKTVPDEASDSLESNGERSTRENGRPWRKATTDATIDPSGLEDLTVDAEWMDDRFFDVHHRLVGMTEKLNESSQDIASLRQELLDSTEKVISYIDKVQKNIDDKLTALFSRIDDVSKNYETQQQDVSDLKSDVDALASCYGSIKNFSVQTVNRINCHEFRLDKLAHELNELNGQDATHQAEPGKSKSVSESVESPVKNDAR